jgi:transposase
MSKARLVITAVIVEGRSQAEVARTYEVSPGWVSKLVARYRSEGEAAFEPRSRRPNTSPNAVSATVVGQIVELRTTLVAAGLDAGPDTIRWHLEHHHGVRVSSATISRYLAKSGLVTPQPQKKPRSSYIRFEADQPNECWQSDFTHYRLVTRSGARVPMWRSSPGWMTTPARLCRSRLIGESREGPSSAAFGKPLPSMGFQPRR